MSDRNNKLVNQSAAMLVPEVDADGSKVEIEKVGTVISGAQTVNTTNIVHNRQMIVVEGAQTTRTTPVQMEQEEMSHDYFSLFVLGNDIDLRNPYGSFFMPRSRLLETVYTQKEIINLIRGFDDESLRRIKSYPALICNENQKARKAEDNRMIYYSQIQNVHVQENGIWFDYLVLNAIPQNSINGIQGDLAIGSTTYFDEMMHTHWSIKQVDLVRVLRQAGFRIFSLS